MADSMLRDILAIEKRIAEHLAEERERARQWLQKEKDAIDQTVEEEMKEATSSACRRGERQCRGAREDAARQLRAMRRRVRELRRIPEDRLRQAIRRHLGTILDGGEHDHPNDQG